MLWSAKGEADEGGMDGDDGGGLMFYDSESSRRGGPVNPLNLNPSKKTLIKL
jgi:hypothetical protein